MVRRRLPSREPVFMSWLASLGQAAGRLAGHGLDLLYPPRCVFCRREEDEGGQAVAVVCGACRRLLSSDGPRCHGCGEPVAGEGSEPIVCRRCRSRLRFEGIVVLSGYIDEIRSAVLATKRPGGELHAAALAMLLLERHRETMTAWQADLVVPVPMHWMRRVTRGTSSADILARHVAKGLVVPARRILYRTRATPMQNELPPEERPANVRGAFRSTKAAAGKKILLVDDVSTTGATLDACREALLSAGAAGVYAAVVARADRGGGMNERGAMGP